MLTLSTVPQTLPTIWCGHMCGLSRPDGAFPSSSFLLRLVHHRSSTPEQSRRKRQSRMHTQTYGDCKPSMSTAVLQTVSPYISPPQAVCLTWASSAKAWGASACGYFLIKAFGSPGTSLRLHLCTNERKRFQRSYTRSVEFRQGRARASQTTVT